MAMAPTVKNLFANLPHDVTSESFATLFENSQAKIERIVSHTYASAAGEWYDQAEDEWVIVLRGDATVEFSGGEFVELKSGDYLTIPRHLKHRVARTGEQTLWLAVHIR
jgi:cupin 2 domain-containing protein